MFSGAALEPCIAGVACPIGYHCDLGDRLCHPGAAEGEPCNAAAPCDVGLYCGVDLVCHSGANEGDPCDWQQHQCRNDLVCSQVDARCHTTGVAAAMQSAHTTVATSATEAAANDERRIATWLGAGVVLALAAFAVWLIVKSRTRRSAATGGGGGVVITST